MQRTGDNDKNNNNNRSHFYPLTFYLRYRSHTILAVWLINVLRYVTFSVEACYEFCNTDQIKKTYTLYMHCSNL